MSTTYEQAALRYEEALSEWHDALVSETAKGTETDAELRKLLAEARIDPEVRGRLYEAREAYAAAKAAHEARTVEAYERLASAQESMGRAQAQWAN